MILFNSVYMLEQKIQGSIVDLQLQSLTGFYTCIYRKGLWFNIKLAITIGNRFEQRVLDISVFATYTNTIIKIWHIVESCLPLPHTVDYRMRSFPR